MSAFGLRRYYFVFLSISCAAGYHGRRDLHRHSHIASRARVRFLWHPWISNDTLTRFPRNRLGECHSPHGDDDLRMRLRHVVFGVQLLLLSLWTVVIPPAIVENGERAASHQPVVLLTMLFLVVAISGAALMRRWITQVDSPLTNLLQSLVPVAI